MIHRMVYVSHPRQPMPPATLRHLARRGAAWNEQRGIVSVLYSGAGLFIHALEGKRPDLMDLMARIRDDERHDAVEIVIDETAPQAAFGPGGLRIIEGRAEPEAPGA